jgi:sec-independent protein translocase protein TatA
MDTIGPMELVIILVIVILVFGVGRIGKIAGELGGGIRAFKNGLEGDDKEKSHPEAANETAELVQAAAAEPVAVASENVTASVAQEPLPQESR